MKIQVNYIMSWEAKDCFKNWCKSNNFIFVSMFRLLIVLNFLLIDFNMYLHLIEKDSSVRSSRPEELYKKGVLRNFAKFTGKQLCRSFFLNKVADLRPATLLKKTLAQVFSCEFCEIYKNTFFHKTPLVAASALSYIVAMFVNSLFVRL